MQIIYGSLDSLSDTIIEASTLMATSGAGGAWARRRRDLSPSLRSLCKLLLFFSFFLLSFISIKPSLLLPFFKVSQIRDREWIWLPANPLPVSPDDAVAQIWGLYRSGKQTKPDPALRPSSRYKSTKNHSKPVAPCPLESSTVHGDALNKAESSCVTKAATLGSFLSAQKYWFNHSTKMEVFPATTSSICESVFHTLRPTSSTNLSLNLTTEFLQQSNDILGQTSEQYLDNTSNGSRSEPSLAPPTAHPHRFSLMARIFLGPSDAPLPVGSSTARGETQSWQVTPLCDSSPIIISEPQNGGDNSSLFPPTATTLGFSWMGLSSFCGPITLTWPMIENCKEAHFTHIFQALCMLTDPSPTLSKSRYTLFNVLSRSLLEIWCLIKDGRRRHPILVATSPDQTCFHQFQNLIDRIDGMSSDANLKLKHTGLVLVSNHRWCDANQASVMFCEHISSKTCSNIKLIKQASSHMGEASKHSRTMSRQITARWIIWPLWSSRTKRSLKKRTISEEETIQEESSAEEDWRKAQVDSKNILAQPHQSTMDARQPPFHLAGIIDDTLTLAKTFRDLSFRFIPRSHNLIVDDLSRKAIRSMTIGPINL